MQNGRSVTRELKSPGLRRMGMAASASAASLLIAGCARAPTFNLLGSFFPAWIVCGVIGILLTLATRLFFIRIKLDQQLKPLVVVYLCLAALFTFTLWLLFFR
jgi:YtcA family